MRYPSVAPKHWTRSIQTALVHVMSLAHYALVHTRSWAANGSNDRRACRQSPINSTTKSGSCAKSEYPPLRWRQRRVSLARCSRTLRGVIYPMSSKNAIAVLTRCRRCKWPGAIAGLGFVNAACAWVMPADTKGAGLGYFCVRRSMR